MNVVIVLDLGLSGDLNFQDAKKKCEEALEKDLKISFELHFGLFSKLKKPLSNQSQYLSFELSLKHFKETLWDRYQSQIKEVIFYSGSLDFSQDFCFDENEIHNFQGFLEDHFLTIEAFCEKTEIQAEAFSHLYPEQLAHSKIGKWLLTFFCRGVKMDYLQMLRSTMPDAMPLCIQLDANGVSDPLLYALLTNQEFYYPFHLILINSWMKEEKSSPFAICLPDKEFIATKDYCDLKKAFDFFQDRKIPCRLIPETALITSWHIVDYLFVATNTLGLQGKRKLQGFVAAEGTIVSLQEKIGFAEELSFEEFIEGVIKKRYHASC